MTVTQTNASADERVLWSGRGERIPWFVPADLFLVPFTFIWTGFVISFGFSAAKENPAALPIPLLLAAMGLYMSLGRLFVRRRRWAQTQYTLTDDRITVSRNGKEESAWLDQLPPPVTAGKHAIGFGSSLSVQGKLAMEGWPMGSWNTAWWSNDKPILVGIDDASALQKQISTAQNEARRSRRAD